jgi:DNA gyrase subunit B
MPQLVERGHIYIAQPPLYKVKRGKLETYVKDDAELNTLLLGSALDSAALHVNAQDLPLRGDALRSLAEQFVIVTAVIQRLARRYDSRVLEQLLFQPEMVASRYTDRTWLIDWAAGLQKALGESANGGGTVYRVELSANDEGVQGFGILRARHGVDERAEVPLRFFASPEYRKIAELGNSLQGLVGADAYVMRGDQRRDVTSFREAMDWLMAEARRGQTIQRYKGLGEMNPEQLWETTVNPASRRLLQVRIEDAVAADEVFTTLMGDQVEPRREFIERNALAAENLDV